MTEPRPNEQELRRHELSKLSALAYRLDRKLAELEFQRNEIENPGLYSIAGEKIFMFCSLTDAIATIEELSRKIDVVQQDIQALPFLARHKHLFERVAKLAQKHNVDYVSPIRKQE